MRLRYECECGKSAVIYAGPVEGVPFGMRLAELIADVEDAHRKEHHALRGLSERQ